MLRTSTLALVALVVLAGCVGAGPAGTTDVDPRTEADTETDANPEIDTAARPTTEAGNVTEFSELTPVQQSAFRDALASNATFVPRNSSYLDVENAYAARHAEPFDDGDRVRYDGSTYRIEFSHGVGFAIYDVRAAPATPESGDTVTAFEDFPESLRDEVRAAVETDSYSSPPGKWGSVPDPLVESDYVRYEGQTYELSIGVADGLVPVMTAEKDDA